MASEIDDNSHLMDGVLQQLQQRLDDVLSQKEHC